MSRTSSQCHLVARYQSRHKGVNRSLWYLPTQTTDTERTTSSSGWTTRKTIGKSRHGYLPLQAKWLSRHHRLLLALDRNQTIYQSNVWLHDQPRQDRIYHAWYSGCGDIRQRKTIRLGRIQEIREIMVLRSTYHKPIFSAREWDGRASCADGEKIARPRRTGDRSVELTFWWAA